MSMVRGDVVINQEAEKRRRVRLALGPQPVENARYLLSPLALPAVTPPLPPGPNPHTEFVIDLLPDSPLVSLDEVRAAFAPEMRARLRFPRLWGRISRSNATPLWKKLDEVAGENDDVPLSSIALTWELTSLLTEGREAAQEMAKWTHFANQRAAFISKNARSRESPSDAVARAVRLNALKARFARATEMRLVPTGRTFPSRAVWRVAYALGLEWGEFDLFHWRDATQTRRLFTLSSLSVPEYFLPERAMEGEGIAGIALAFELPHNPIPLETYDRMAVALSFLRQQLGGRTVTREGTELDADRLHRDRDMLEKAIEEMTRAEIAPGSPQAANFF